MANRHTFAKGMVKTSVGRLEDPLKYLAELEGKDDRELRVAALMLINQQIIVTGAVLEEVSTVANGGWKKKLKDSTVQALPPFAGMGGILFLLSVLNVI